MDLLLVYFSKFFFTKSWKFLCDYVIFSPKYAIFYIHFTTKYPSFWAKIFWTQKSKENLRNSVLLMPCFVLEYYPPEVTQPTDIFQVYISKKFSSDNFKSIYPKMFENKSAKNFCRNPSLSNFRQTISSLYIQKCSKKNRAKR